MEYVRLLPKNTLSRFVGKVVRVKNPSWLATAARDWFIERYKINIAEAEKPLSEYPSIGDLFIRKLKPGLRPVGEGIVHPCDANLTRAGQLENGMILQAKGIEYSIQDLLKDPKAAETFAGGHYLTYYLCPTDYHRVHTPVEGEVTSIKHIPGRLWPVNPWSVENISQLFAINERLVFNLKTQYGPVALVMVGATNVGEISVSFDPSIRTNVAGGEVSEKFYAPPVKLEKAQEVGIFHMGSSVVMLYPKGAIKTEPRLGPVKMGASLSHIEN
ncbi:MAG: archaetidylserine decarboxylase [Bdellovibrionota bacterium]